MEIFVPSEWSYVFEMTWKQDETKVTREDIPEKYALRILAILDEMYAEYRDTGFYDMDVE